MISQISHASQDNNILIDSITTITIKKTYTSKWVPSNIADKKSIRLKSVRETAISRDHAHACVLFTFAMCKNVASYIFKPKRLCLSAKIIDFTNAHNI